MSAINKAFNLPLHSDGEKLIEATGNICAVFNLPNEAASIAHFVNSRDDLIEQLQQRNGELERERADVAKKAFTKGASFGHFNWRKIPFDSTLVPEAAEQCANTKYPSVKDGE